MPQLCLCPETCACTPPKALFSLTKPTPTNSPKNKIPKTYNLRLQNPPNVSPPPRSAQWLGHPIVGDKEYGDSEADYRLSRRNANRVDVHRPLLHSMTLEFNHPYTNKRMSFRAPIPADMWETADNILRASGTVEQQEEFGELQETHQTSAADTAPVGGRGSPRFATRKGRKGGRGGSGAREAYEAVLAAEANQAEADE